MNSNWHDWDWDDYCANWDAHAATASIGMDVKEVRNVHDNLVIQAEFRDPLFGWYDLVRFISIVEKDRLRGAARLGQDLLAMEHMVRMFESDLTGERVSEPNDGRGFDKKKYLGVDPETHPYRALEFIVNRYDLNSNPRLVLLVEGHGEEEQFPRLARDFFGYDFDRLGIKVINLKGVGNISGRNRRVDWREFADFLHERQSLVHVVVDNEGKTAKVKSFLADSASRYSNARTVLSGDNFHIWDKCVEMDNFSNGEIARALSTQGACRFSARDVKKLRDLKDAASELRKLYRDRTHRDLDKRQLLADLCGVLLEGHTRQSVWKRRSRRPVLKMIRRVLERASTNHLPISEEMRQRNQASGQMGDAPDGGS